MPDSQSLHEFLHTDGFAPAVIIATDDSAIVLDLSRGSRLRGTEIAGQSVQDLAALIDDEMRNAGTGFAFGRYGEPRELYSNDDFIDVTTGEARTIHLGIDLFCRADTPIYSPLDGTVEVVANNDRALDYGPMMIVRHTCAGPDPFFTLYGHLSLDALDRIAPGQRVEAGEQIAAVGEPPSNGNWPPHLHFQLITDLLGKGADFPGVACTSRQEYWFCLSPSPAVFFPECSAHSLEFP
jgi:hypothetical protein